MTDATPRLQRGLRTAAYLLVMGLLVEVATLYWASPISFLSFIVIGALLVFAGVLIYLWTIVRFR